MIWKSPAVLFRPFCVTKPCKSVCHCAWKCKRKLIYRYIVTFARLCCKKNFICLWACNEAYPIYSPDTSCYTELKYYFWNRENLKIFILSTVLIFLCRNLWENKNYLPFASLWRQYYFQNHCIICTLLFNFVSYVFLLLCLCILILCIFCSVYSVIIVPTGILRLPWLKYFHAFSSAVRQIPGYTSQRWGTARTLPN